MSRQRYHWHHKAVGSRIFTEVVNMFNNKIRLIIRAALACTESLPMLRYFRQAERRKEKAYPHSSTRQRERGARQIASGMCKHANGLVRPGQVLVTEGGKMFIRRPY